MPNPIDSRANYDLWKICNTCSDPLSQELTKKIEDIVKKFHVDVDAVTPDASDKSGKKTLLHLASARGNVDLVKLLIGPLGAEMYLRDQQHKTPYECAANAKIRDVFEQCNYSDSSLRNGIAATSRHAFFVESNSKSKHSPLSFINKFKFSFKSKSKGEDSTSSNSQYDKKYDADYIEQLPSKPSLTNLNEIFGEKLMSPSCNK